MSKFDPPTLTTAEMTDPDDQWTELRESLEWRARELEDDTSGESPPVRNADWASAESALLERMPVELRETEASFRVCAQLPMDFSADDVDVSVEGGSVSIRGRRRNSTLGDEAEGEVVYSEFDDREVFRQIELPDSADSGDIDVRLDARQTGTILRIDVAKADQRAA